MNPSRAALLLPSKSRPARRTKSALGFRRAAPLIVASNHPHGALDGLVLASILLRHRSDVRILTNHLLARIPELADLCFFVDPFGGARRTRAARPDSEPRTCG